MAVADIIESDVTDFAPTLATTLSAGAWTAVLAYVNQFDMSSLGETAQTIRLGRILLAAHLGTLSVNAGNGAAGPITSQSAGALRVSYATFAMATSTIGFSLTPYGQQYLSLLNMSAAHGPMLTS